MFTNYLKNALLIASFLAVPGSFVHAAGAVLKMYRLDVPGKKIILFGEQHDGTFIVHGKTILVDQLAQKQQIAFFNLFNDFESLKNSIALYLEARDSYCKDIKSFFSQHPTLCLQGNAPSFFTYYYECYATQVPQANYVDVIGNFDMRKESAHVLTLLADRFDTFLQEWKNDNYNQEYFEQSKKSFYALPEYIVFKREFEDAKNYNLDLLVEKLLANLSSSAIYSFLPQKLAEELINQRTKGFAVFKALSDKSAFVDKDFYELLFDIAQVAKENFFPIVSQISNTQLSIKSISEIFLYATLATDFNLIAQVYKDRHPLVLVHCGHYHAQVVFDVLRKMNGVRRAQELNLLEEHMIDDPDYCYQMMRKFVFE